MHRTEDFELLASEIPDKSAWEVGEYYPIFKKKWKTLADHARIATRIQEGEAKRNKRSNLEALLAEKINSVVYPMQELELNYPSTKGKVYSEEEDRYLLCRLNHYGMQAEDVYERIKRDISEFPVFRFDWFFKSRSPQELARRCTTLLGMIEKEAEAEKVDGVKKGTTSRGKVRLLSFQIRSFLTSETETGDRRSPKGGKGVHKSLTIKYAVDEYHRGGDAEAAEEDMRSVYIPTTDHRPHQHYHSSHTHPVSVLVIYL